MFCTGFRVRVRVRVRVRLRVVQKSVVRGELWDDAIGQFIFAPNP